MIRLARFVNRRRCCWKLRYWNAISLRFNDRRKSVRRAKVVAQRLKRLQRQIMWRWGRCERRVMEESRAMRKEERLEMKYIRQKVARPPSECPLWNCLRKRRRSHRLRRFRRPSSRSTVLSSLSKRSRSPVVLRTSPIASSILGFPVPYSNYGGF